MRSKLENKSKKVAFVMQESRMGGIEYNSIHLAKALKTQGFEIVFLCPEEGKLTRRLKEESLPYLFYRRLPFISTSVKIFGRYVFNPITTLYNFLTFPLIIGSLTATFRREKFKLVVAKGLISNFYTALAAFVTGIPCLWDMQEIVSREKALGFLRFMLNLWALLFVRGIVVPARATFNQFWESLHNKIKIIPNGIDTDQYHPRVDSAPVREEWGIKPDEVLIGHIARFTYWKGQRDFIRAAVEIMKRNKNTKFVLVGSPVFEGDSYEKEIRLMAAESGHKEKFLFPGFRDDLAQVMAALDIFVHSSTESEGCPITLITAMSMAKPVVATDVEGNNELINSPQQAILVSPENPEAISRAVLTILENPELRAELSQHSRQRILEAYSLAGYSKKSRNYFELLSAG